MAETGKKPDPKVTENSGSTSEAKAVPAKDEYVRVRTTYPHATFSVEGVPTIDTEGVVLTKEQADKAKELAPTYGVRLNVEEVK
jgi:hypothetical protein